MTLYGNTCPMCCGDIDSDRAGPSVCQSCGCNTEASASTARQPEALASGGSKITEISPLQDIQIQTSASAALTELTTR
jgi:reverse gyrase